MRYLILLAIVFLGSCRLSTEHEKISSEMVIAGHEEDDVLAGIDFEEAVHKFGTVSQGETVDFHFKFKNTGDVPLVIASVKPACGCTLIDSWPQEPIAPGGSGEIPVRFNSADQKGHISKSITLIANTRPKTTVLNFEGEVMAPDLNQAE